MKDWLTVIIVLLIVGIILDGVRRMRLAKRESIALSKNAKKADEEGDFNVSSSEFPSGGARVAAVRDEKVADSLNENVRKSFETQRSTTGSQRKIPEQVSLNLEASVPMLMDSVEEERVEDDGVQADGVQADGVQKSDVQGEALSETASSRQVQMNPEEADVENDPSVGADSTSDADEYDDPREPSLGNFADLNDDIPAEPKPIQESVSQGEPPAQSSPELSRNTVSDSSNTHYQTEKAEKKEKPNRVAEEKASEPQYKEPEEVLIMNLMAKPGTRIAGGALLEALMAEKLKFGDMEIFHRHKDNDGDGPIIYSIANMVVPGTFNLSAMDEFETPGVSIFLSLPVEEESLAAYNDMATTAKRLAATLDCDLKDENRSVMTGQTIEHGRQRVVEYERKRKLARA